MPGEDNAALVAKFLDELWNKRNLAIIDQLTTENYVVHLAEADLLGREALKIVAEYYLEFFSIIHVNIVNQTSQDSQVVTRVGWETALSFRDQPLDLDIDRVIPARGVSIDRIENGQIAESWNMLDTPYWIYNAAEVSRNPDFVRDFPAVTTCPPPCSAGHHCQRGHCVPNKRLLPRE